MNVQSDSRIVRDLCRQARAQGKCVGLVPTMGALHEGHLVLIRRARARCDYVVVSIFVNPDQFGAGEDFARYPRQAELDRSLCEAQGADLLFTPGVENFASSSSTVFVYESRMSLPLCGRFRPGHFQGVLTVVAKLFNVVEPDVAILGQKDAQQFRLIEQMVHDLEFGIEIDVVPTVREADGLAKSSRNAYLSDSARREAICLYDALRKVANGIAGGESKVATLKAVMHDCVAGYALAELEYAEILDYDTLQSIEEVSARIIAAICVRFGDTRLIDNLVLSAGGESWFETELEEFGGASE